MNINGVNAMRQERINRLVARATGEDMREIRRMGFSIADPAHVGFDPEPRRKRSPIIDWDTVEQEHGEAVCLNRPRKRLA